MKDQKIKNKAAADPVKNANFQGAPKISNATDSLDADLSADLEDDEESLGMNLEEIGLNQLSIG